MNNIKNTNRRSFLQQASLAAVSALAVPKIVSAAFAAEPSIKKIALKKGDVVLFQGDSITDAGRKKDDAGSNNASALGNGYAMIAASELLLKQAEKNLSMFNRGISGNKVYQLAERWEKDCLEVKPNVVSILIGVNDYWHKHNGRYDGTVKKYRDDYTALLERTKRVLPGVKLIIGEPFAVTGIKAVDQTWYPEFNEYRAAARHIAAAFDAVFIPYQSVFDKAQKTAPGVYWTHDGVHPSLAGSRLMAQAWLEAVN